MANLHADAQRPARQSQGRQSFADRRGRVPNRALLQRQGRRMLMDTLRRFAAARGGVAAIEFALILPVMLVLLIGSVQITDYIICSQKISNLANTAADLVTQSTAHDDTAMANVWNALNTVAYPYDAGSIKAVVSGLAHGDKTGEIVSWSIQHGGAVQHPVNSRMIVPDGISAV